ncbi:YugE family protein [Lysinibacillus piscis]|uniref:YugE family protein n=1 Tax=Lysinibacillus piscis TaxID=2518931 RepID=UPI002230E44C|nr:YugE family protein [Lysinibacillus sp. KH24]
MENIKMNRTAVHLLESWDPFHLGPECYDTEIADVVAALQSIDDPSALAKTIQETYEYSFEEWIPFEECVAISYKLIAIKFEAKCII